MNANVRSNVHRYTIHCTYRDTPVQAQDFPRTNITIGLFAGGSFKWETAEFLKGIDRHPRDQRMKLALYFKQKRGIHQWALEMRDVDAPNGYRVALESELRDFIASPESAPLAGQEMYVVAPGSYVAYKERQYVAAFRSDGESLCCYDVLPLGTDGLWVLLVAREEDF
jgi:hypothetical protein